MHTYFVYIYIYIYIYIHTQNVAEIPTTFLTVTFVLQVN